MVMRGFIGKRARSYCAVGIHIQAFIRRRLSSRRCGAMCGGSWRRSKEERWRRRRADLWRRLRGCCWSSRWTGHMSCVFDRKTIHSLVSRTLRYTSRTRIPFSRRALVPDTDTHRQTAPHLTTLTVPSLPRPKSRCPFVPLSRPHSLSSVFFDRSLIDRQHIRPPILLPPSPLLRRVRK